MRSALDFFFAAQSAPSSTCLDARVDLDTVAGAGADGDVAGAGLHAEVHVTGGNLEGTAERAFRGGMSLRISSV